MATNKLLTQFSVTRLRVGIFQIGLVLVALYVIARFNYLLFHVLSEFFGAAISLAIFLLAWNARKFSKNNYYLFFGMAFLISGIISLAHALAYKGMGVMAGTANDSNIATQLWLANQFVLAATFVIAPFLLQKKIRTQSIPFGYLAALAFFLVVIFYWKIFPVAYAEGVGLTSFKKISEYIVAASFLVSLYFYWRRRDFPDNRSFQLVSFMLALFFVSTISFTLYVGVYSFPNELGHLLRVLAFYVSYLALVEFGLMKPYHSIFKDLKDREVALKKAKSEWERTFDSVPDLVAILDKNHQIVRANKAMAERLGTTPDACIGMKCYQVVHKCNQPIENCPHVQSLLDGKEHISEVHEPNLGGDFIVSTTPFHDENGDLIGCVHVARDITERKKAEEIMSDLAKFPLENPSPVMRVSSDGKLLYANPAANILLNEFRLKEDETFPNEWKKVIQESIEKNSKKNFEMNAAGKKFFILIAPIADTSYANIYSTDITERQKAEVALNYEKEKLKQILDKMEDGVYIVDKNYTLIYTNPALERYLGPNTNNKKCFEYLHDFESPCIWCRNKEVFSGKSVHWECYFEKIKKTFDIIETPMVSQEGAPIKLEILRDITEKKRMEKAKDDFISLASHQLRTPLSAISLSSELLLRGISGEVPREQKEYIEEINQAAKRMSLLVSNFLNVSRIEMGTFSVETESFDIVPTVEAKLKYFLPILLEKKLEFEKKIERDLPLALFNANSFEIVFDNLFSNAIRYTPAGGRISLSLGKKGNSVVLEISDTGCGIPQNLKEKVFEKSFRSDAAKKISSEGAGLGLYMVKSIADLTGSKVWYESTEGKETNFYFSIPL